MNIRDLEYFLRVSETGSISEAAKICFVSQPTLSMQLKKLEGTLGVTLFERHNRQLRITAEGIQLAAKANEILLNVKEIKEMAKSFHDPYSGKLEVGVIRTLGPYVMPKVLPAMRSVMPDMHFHLCEMQSFKILKLLKSGDLDIGILAADYDDPALESADLFEEPLDLMVSNDHALANHKSVMITDLKGHDVLSLEPGHCLRTLVDDLIMVSGANEVHQFRGTSLESLRHMVSIGEGITMLPRLAAMSSLAMHIGTVIPFADPTPKRKVKLYWRKGASKVIVFKKIQEILHEEISSFLQNRV